MLTKLFDAAGEVQPQFISLEVGMETNALFKGSKSSLLCQEMSPVGLASRHRKNLSPISLSDSKL
jgi:hypothetical protein